ncbi:hypothetical protein FKF97_10865 [Clostridium perfringens]|nr:hypothetical protein [Clostridium perfringens]
MQFRDLYFQFDGINSKEKRLKLITVDSKNNRNLFGVEQDIIEEENGTDVPLFLGVKRKCPTIPVTLMKMNEWNRPIPYGEKELSDICNWLFKREYKPFVSWDNPGVVYYVIFIKGEGFENCAKEGYLNLEMRLSAPHAYSRLLTDEYHVLSQKTVYINNDSDIQDFIYPDIEFEMLDDCTDLIIENLTIGEKMEFNNLEKGEKIKVYNDGLKDMLSLVDRSRNIFEKSNKYFIKLVYGRNRIRITGKCKIKFITQYPLALK